MINSDVTKLAVSILDSEAKWQLMKSEVNRLAKLRDEAIASYNKAVMLKDELVRPSPNELELAKYVTLIESREGDNTIATCVSVDDLINILELIRKNGSCWFIGNERGKQT